MVEESLAIPSPTHGSYEEDFDDEAFDASLDVDIVDATFAQYAVRKNGPMETKDLSSFLSDLGYDLYPDQVEDALDIMDADATGLIEKMSFLQWFQSNGDDLGNKNRLANTTKLSIHEKTTTKKEKKLDSPLKSINNAMLEAKLERKRAEDDVQLLANRLAHLRTEEAKARKRIEDANRRANEIQAIKISRVKQELERQKQLNQEKKSRQNSTISHSKVADESRRRRAEVASKQIKVNVIKAKSCKEEKAIIQEQIMKNKEEERQRILRKKEAVKKQQEEAMRNRELQKKKQEEALEKKARERLAAETTKKLLHEQRIREMEEEEARLIESLQKTQDTQREAYKRLEEALKFDAESSLIE